jgi:hypothetical protein
MLPVWPGPMPPPLIANLYAPYARRRELRRQALDDDYPGTLIDREPSQSPRLGRRLRGSLSFDDTRASVIGWEMFERADALLHEALDATSVRR